jgi:hypothetical protein
MNGSSNTRKKAYDTASTTSTPGTINAANIATGPKWAGFNTYCQRTWRRGAWIKYTLYENVPTNASGLYDKRCLIGCPSVREVSTSNDMVPMPMGRSIR